MGLRAHLTVMAVAVLLIPFAGAAERTVTVLYTADVHARVLPCDEIRRAPARGSLAQVASLVAAVRRKSPLLIVLDGGDTIQGTPLAHYALTDKQGSGFDPSVAAMNLAGYDAAVLGNHEFNYGLEVLARSIRQSRFPWLAANLEGAVEAGLQVQPAVILQRGGVRIGVLGLTNPNVPNWDPPSHWQGLAFLDPVEVARAQVDALRPKVDILVVVAHGGFERDLDGGEETGSGPENFAWELTQIEGIDLLLTGHSHRNIPPRPAGNTVVAQPGRWAELVTRVDIDLRRRGNRWQVVGWRGENISTAELQADERVVAAVEQVRLNMLVRLDEEVGRLARSLVLGGVPTRDDPATDLIHRVQLWATEAHLSLAAPLAMAPMEVPAGPVTPRVLHALYPYPNTLVAVALTGAQVRDVLEHAVRGWSGVECRSPAPCVLRRDPRLPGYNYDTLEGATYAVDVGAPPGARIRGLRVGGVPIDPEATYSVAVNSYRASGAGGFPHLKQAPRLREINRQMVDLLADYFREHGAIDPEASDNHFFVFPLLAEFPVREATAP